MLLTDGRQNFPAPFWGPRAQRLAGLRAPLELAHDARDVKA
jgi:hypothetical protein